MAKKKKTTTKKKAAGKPNRPVSKKAAKPAKAASRKKAVQKKVAPKKIGNKKAVQKKSAGKKPTSNLRRRPSSGANEALPMIKGRGSASGGQSGDTLGLSDVEGVDSESVEELVEEGQDFEAEIVNAVENAPDPDEGELNAEVPEDDLDPDAGSFSKRNRL
jgi:hypothetical protein